MSNDKIANEIMRIRFSQILINEDYKAGKFKIPIHLSFGHEAIAVAVNNSMKKNDNLVLTHRNMSFNLARLGRLAPIMDEYHLRSTGLANGRLGSMNLLNTKNNIVYSSSILGNNYPVAAGIAMGAKLEQKGSVTFVLGGDGSMEEGSLYESLLMMKSIGLSVLVIIENNEWSLGTHITERRSDIDLAKFSGSLGIHYEKLEGNNVDDYISLITKCREDAIERSEPVCIEIHVKTLGDRRNPPTPEYPEGKYINYHAGPSPTVDLLKNYETGVLKESSDDPVFVIGQKIGMEKLAEMSNKILNDLKAELL